MQATKGQMIKVKESKLEVYIKLGYTPNKRGYRVTNVEPVGAFIKEYSRIILHNDYEIVEDKK